MRLLGLSIFGLVLTFARGQEQQELMSYRGSGAVLSSFPAVDINELNPLTLSWNQVGMSTNSEKCLSVIFAFQGPLSRQRAAGRGRRPKEGA